MDDADHSGGTSAWRSGDPHQGLCCSALHLYDILTGLCDDPVSFIGDVRVIDKEISVSVDRV